MAEKDTSMSRILKIAAPILLALALLPVLAYLGVLVVNRKDQPQGAAVVRLVRLVSAIPEVRPQDNGYVYVMGFGAAMDQDPLALGTQRVAWTFQAGPGEHADFPTKDYPREEGRTNAMTVLGDACRSVDRACLAELEKGGATIDHWLGADGWILHRYQKLLSLPEWRETAALDAGLPFPPYGLVLDGQRLLLLQAWNDAGRGDTAAVKDQLQRDGVFWRRTLAASDTVLAKMIAMGGIKRHYEWGNLIMRRLPHDKAPSAVPEHWRTPFTQLERSMLRLSAGEFMFAAANARSLPPTRLREIASARDVVTALTMPLFQPHDYENRYATLVTSVADTLDVPIESYPAAARQARVILEKAVAGAFDQPLYNWPGNELIARGAPDLIGFAVRVADLEGVRRLALLATELRLADAAPTDMLARLSAAPLRDPYSGKPFGWDAGAGTLIFVGVYDGPYGRHALLY